MNGVTIRIARAAALGLWLLACTLLALPAEAQTMWKNGRWFDGTGFVERTMYSTEAGLLSSKRPANVRATVDLEGRYVVPAYGDAHHHGIDGEAGLDEKIAAFLRDGIFYVKNPNVIPDLLTPALRARINRPDSVDVTFANGGLTGTGGHPGPLHDRLADGGVFPGLRRQDMPGRAYFYVDSRQDLEAVWPGILAGRPDFIKVFLNGRERAEHRNGSKDTEAGVSEEVLRLVVHRAHASRLRVTAHVDTATDFATAVRAGVDELAHMPAYDPRAKVGPEANLVSPEAAAEAARRGTTVVATVSVLPRLAGDRWSDSMRALALGVEKRNIAVLNARGVKLAVGSDGISGEASFPTAKSEVEYLRRNGLADGLALLRMWAVNTPRTIFPNRKIGRLQTGYEANFLALDGDPIADSDNLHRIGLRVKAGKVLRGD